MLCRFTLLRRKEVINLCDGCRLGCVGDVEVQIPEELVSRFARVIYNDLNGALERFRLDGFHQTT